jgi:hypothetical protein
MKSSFKIDFRNLLAVVTRHRLVVKADRRSPRHFTLFFEPQKKGRHQYVTPHVSDERRRGGRKPFFARIRPETLERCSRAIGRALGDLLRARLKPVTLQDLEDDGWFIVLPDELKFFEYVEGLRDPSNPARYRVRETDLENMTNFVVARIAPTKLANTTEPLRTPLGAMRMIENGEFEATFLGYWGSFSSEGGWFTFPLDWLPEEEMLSLLVQHTPRTFWIGVRRVMELLDASDLAGVDGILSRYDA